MLWSQAKRYPFWHFIADKVTNLGRQEDSDRNSNANLEIQESMLNCGGWSDQFPMAAVSMKNWPECFTVDPGCSAEDYIAREMARRQQSLEDLKKDVTEDGVLRLEAFITLFCNKDGELHKLTLSNGKWVHSGHQRTQFDYLTAYTLYLIRLRNNAKIPDTYTDGKGNVIVNDKPLIVEWIHEIPCVVGTYTDEMDILKDQLQINAAAGKQNKLKVFDMLKAAIMFIGSGFTPNGTERQFRELCAIPTSDKDKGGNSGAGPRHAFLLGLVNYFYAGALGFAKKITAEPKLTDKAGDKYPNPDYIALSEVALGHDDPMCDISVIVRLMEPSLKRLKEYIETYGKGSKRVTEQGKADTVSAIEYQIWERKSPFTLEEGTAWMKSRCLNAPPGIRAEPLVIKTPEAFDVKKLDGLIESERVPEVVRDVLAQLVGKQKDIASPVMANVQTVAQDMRSQLNAVWSLDIKNPFDKMLLDCITTATDLRDGNPEAYQAVLPCLVDCLNNATVAKVESNEKVTEEPAKAE